MPTRTRTDFRTRTGYHYNRMDSITNQRTVDDYRDVITDDTGAGDCLPLTISKYKVLEHGLVNGVTSGPGWHDEFVDYPSAWSFGSNANHLAVSGIPSDGILAAKLLADTNPSRPTVDLPVFIGELKDFPQLFKVIGENIFKTTAKANLAYHFGWKPLMSDLLGMMNFANVVKDRRKELEALFNSGLRRTRELGSGSSTSQVLNNPIFSIKDPWFVDITRTTQVRVWGHCKWKPNGLPPRTDEEMRRLAIRAAYGLTIDPATAWELIPFSWLVDWCSSVGNYLAAQRNIVNATPYDIVIMRHTKTLTSSVTRKAPATLVVGSPPKVLRESKVRNPASPSLNAYLPAFTAKQLSILGSLAILRGRKTRGDVWGKLSN